MDITLGNKMAKNIKQLYSRNILNEFFFTVIFD